MLEPGPGPKGGPGIRKEGREEGIHFQALPARAQAEGGKRAGGRDSDGMAGGALTRGTEPAKGAEQMRAQRWGKQQALPPAPSQSGPHSAFSAGVLALHTQLRFSPSGQAAHSTVLTAPECQSTSCCPEPSLQLQLARPPSSDHRARGCGDARTAGTPSADLNTRKQVGN